MSYYRLYFLNDEERIRRVVELHCADDREAAATAAAYAGPAAMELWNLDRRIGRFNAIDGGPVQGSTYSS